MFWKGDPARERGMWFILAVGGMVRRLVRSKVWLKGVASWPEPSWSVVAVVEDRSGRTVTYRQMDAKLKRKGSVMGRWKKSV